MFCFSIVESNCFRILIDRSIWAFVSDTAKTLFIWCYILFVFVTRNFVTSAGDWNYFNINNRKKLKKKLNIWSGIAVKHGKSNLCALTLLFLINFGLNDENRNQLRIKRSGWEHNVVASIRKQRKLLNRVSVTIET